MKVDKLFMNLDLWGKWRFIQNWNDCVILKMGHFQISQGGSYPERSLASPHFRFFANHPKWEVPYGCHGSIFGTTALLGQCTRMCVAYFGPGCVFLGQRANSKYNTPITGRILAFPITGQVYVLFRICHIHLFIS